MFLKFSIWYNHEFKFPKKSSDSPKMITIPLILLHEHLSFPLFSPCLPSENGQCTALVLSCYHHFSSSFPLFSLQFFWFFWWRKAATNSFIKMFHNFHTFFQWFIAFRDRKCLILLVKKIFFPVSKKLYLKDFHEKRQLENGLHQFSLWKNSWKLP